jgi:hypothetical protein
MRTTTSILGGTVLTAAAVLWLGGCAATNDAGDGRHSDVSGMMCPKCETVWVAPRTTGSGSPKVQAMHWGREMVCPDCDAMAASYFKDGQKVLHDCPTCNVTPRPAKPYTPSHPKGTHI